MPWRQFPNARFGSFATEVERSKNLLDHLVGAREKRRRHLKPERSRHVC